MMPKKKLNKFSNLEIVTLATYLLKGEIKELHAEDIAVKSYEISPKSFAWKKYPEFIHLGNVQKRLYDARKEGYLNGSDKKGWILTQKGVRFAKEALDKNSKSQFSKKKVLTLKEKQWFNSEKTRMLTSMAYEKIQNNESDMLTQQEIESFFRIDEYVTGDTRLRKINRIVNNFSDDKLLGKVVLILAEKV